MWSGGIVNQGCTFPRAQNRNKKITCTFITSVQYNTIQYSLVNEGDVITQ